MRKLATGSGDPNASVESIESLVRNPKNHRKIAPQHLARIVKSLRTFGQGKPIVVNRTGRIVLAGHATLSAAQSLGWDSIAVRWVDLPDAKAQAYAIADNETQKGRYEKEGLADVLREIEEADKEALAAVGMDAEKIDKLIHPDPDLVKVVDVSSVNDQFWMTIRGPLKVEIQVLDKLKQSLENIEGVECDIGISEVT